MNLSIVTFKQDCKFFFYFSTSKCAMTDLCVLPGCYFLLYRNVCRKQELIQLDLEQSEDNLTYKTSQRDALVIMSSKWILQISLVNHVVYLTSLCLKRIFSYFYLLRRQRPGTGDIATPPRLSVRLSVTFSFRTVTQKRIDVFSRNFEVCAPCHGGVLYSFWYWWNVVWIFYEFFKYWKK